MSLIMLLGEIAEKVGAELKGDGSITISAVATLQAAEDGQIAFLANSRYRKYLATTSASAVILSAADAELCPSNALVSDNPYLTYAKVAALLNPDQTLESGVHPSAVIGADCSIDPSAQICANAVIQTGVVIDAGAYIGPGCVIEGAARVGADTRLVANVTVCRDVIIGRRVIIHPGAVVGADGFGFANDRGTWFKVPQLGSVNIGDDVEIGANTTIDRGALEDTVIGAGAKLDNQVQVAHNVQIGEQTAIAGCVGIAGSTKIGKRCQIGGGVGIVGHLNITDDVYVTAMSLVTGNINKPGLYSSGTALEPNKNWQKNAARFKQLDELARTIKYIEKGRES